MLTGDQRRKYAENDITIGIDPGNSGGGIAVSAAGIGVVETIKMSELTPQDMFFVFHEYHYHGRAVAVLERVGGMPGQGGMSMFRFGKNVGHIEMALLAVGIPFLDEMPQTWQKEYHLGTRGKRTKTEWKNVLKAHAQRLYPSLKITNEIADAVLLMHYGLMRRAKGTL